LTKFTKKVDACIIGSGAGGGVVAKELGERGINVVVLEAGRRLDPLRDYPSARPDWEITRVKNRERLFTVAPLQKVTFGNSFNARPNEVHGVGGGTLRYLAYAVRMLADDFKVFTVDGVGADWPISYEDLAPYYRKVEWELGVSGRVGDPWTPRIESYPNPPFEFSYANKIIKRGCDKLGITLWPTPMARLSRPFDNRPMCVQCGSCGAGCMSGAKSSIDVTYIPKAEASGKVVVRSESVATRIRVDAHGKAKSVIYFDKNGVEHEQKADVIIVSGGTIQSPRLLLNSKSKLFPDGLANSSGLVGKYFMQHLSVFSSALFSEPIDSFRGFFGGATSQDLAETVSTNSYVRGWTIELHSGLRYPLETARHSRMWGGQLKNYMRKYFGHAAGITNVGEQLPDERNCVELDPEVKDEYGMPVPLITYIPRKNDRLMMAAMEKNIKEIYDAAGATETLYLNRGKPGGGAHNMGTCRMGKDPKSSVLNSFCQSHDVPNLFVIDGSCFVTGGTANPSLTIHAIALRASEYIVGEGKKKNL
jgi:choline dehydrogenase-like flavoprotein